MPAVPKQQAENGAGVALALRNMRHQLRDDRFRFTDAGIIEKGIVRQTVGLQQTEKNPDTNRWGATRCLVSADLLP